MSEIQIFDQAGSKTAALEVSQEAFSEGVSPALLHRAVVSYEANLRQGSANTKTRGERVGSGKKLWKQKGTGRARMGSIRSPLWRGGGVTFGPKPRDFSMKLSKKEKQAALGGVLAGKLLDGELFGIESVELSEAKTKTVASFLKASGLAGKVLFVTDGVKSEWLRAARNIPNVEVFPHKDLNALMLLKSKNIIFEKAVLEQMLNVEAA